MTEDVMCAPATLPRPGLLLLALAACSCSPCSDTAQAEDVRLRVGEVTSSSVELRWLPVRGADHVRIWLGPEPPVEESGDFPLARRLRTLPGEARRYRIEGLAPGVDAFVRVEARVGDTRRSETIHVRTRGGPGAPLDGPVRSVEGWAPDILRVVLVDVDGERMQRGPWQVRRADGSSIRVEAVHRHSVPVAQPQYELGYGADHDPERVTVDHRLFLVLAEPVGSPELLRVRGPEGVALRLPFSDRWLQTPVVQLNQVGYAPNASQRWAYVSGWMGDGGPLELDDFPEQVEVLAERGGALPRRPTVTRGLSLAERAEHDADAGAPVRQIDLSSVPADEGARYRIRVPGVGVSWPTRVSRAAGLEAFRVTARGLFHNRWGGDLDPEHTAWPRPADHRYVYTSEREDPLSFFPEDTPKRGKRELRGGYHDAGDFDQRPMHVVVAQLVMRAYELSPDRFTDGQLDLPESGNGIPDLLDEALWGVSGWAQLQEGDGGVRGGVESHRHPWGIYPAHEDPLPYWTFARDPAVTARAAGLFAQAARLVRPFDESRASRLESRSKRAWKWADEHGVGDPHRLYALGELHRMEPNAKWGEELEATWDRIGQYGAFSQYATTQLRLTDFAGEGHVASGDLLGYLGASETDDAIAQRAQQWLVRMADQSAKRVLESPHAHRSARGSEPLGWGQSTVMGRWLDPIFACMAWCDVDEERRSRWRDAVSVAADYVLGANPLGMVFITGLGSRSPQHPVHLDSLVWVQRGRPPMPGIPVYGPVDAVPQASYYRHGLEAFHPPFAKHPPMRRYADLRTFPVTNECTVWECQAPHVLHFAAWLYGGSSE